MLDWKIIDQLIMKIIFLKPCFFIGILLLQNINACYNCYCYNHPT